MAKTRFWFSLGYKLLVGLIAGATLASQFNSLGTNAWRLLETWLLLVAAIYFFISAFAEWFRRKQPMLHRSFCPLLQGMIIVIGIGLCVIRVVYELNAIEWMGARDFLNYLQLIFIPLCTIIDWLIFTKKGGWGLSYPWYWLGIVISYCCIILLTTDFIPGQDGWKYPYFFLNYQANGVDNLILWTLLISVVVLAIGYILVLLDYTISGQLNQHIVMPKIKTIVIEEPPVIEPEVITSSEATKANKVDRINSQPVVPKSTLKPKKQSDMDIVKSVEGLKDQKSAQKIHRANKNSNKSKSEIIADIRLQVSGNKNSKARPRAPKKS